MENLQSQKNNQELVAIPEKYMLTIREAASYFNIGIKNMGRLCESNEGEFSIRWGNKYLISSNNICHIHGNAGDRNTNIYFGHGDDTEFNEFEHYIGVTDAYNSLKRELRKNTNQAVVDNINFFCKLSGIKKYIHMFFHSRMLI